MTTAEELWSSADFINTRLAEQAMYRDGLLDRFYSGKIDGPRYVELYDSQETVTRRLIDRLNELIRIEFPIQDEIWPSRRWNHDHTISQDQSG